MDIEQKLAVGKEKKATGDECFRSGDYKGALRAYHEAGLYLNGLDKSLLPALTGGGVPDPETNQVPHKRRQRRMSCSRRFGQTWQNENNSKAKYRKAKAYAAQGYTEKAIDILEELLKQDPNDVLMKKDLEDIKIKQAATEKKGLAKFKGMYNRPSKEEKSGDDGEKVEEVKSPGVAASS
ncbi:TPR-2 domain-containing protein [Rhizoctonia solani]|uniref:peptidylprolyl isomerase n=1 Tax=Rhizoctonia solani TaxID=456999 RepID=A0A8H8NTE5_9AGAM|nr:TPR-2 domain-containing protein [Rhizoctonia solani]QRW18111.1 TPR-2 domain-containing protein [Rhizoctonia solani]